MKTLTGHSDAVWCVAVFPDCSRIVSGSGDETVKVWDAKSGTNLMTLTENSFSAWDVVVHCVSVFPDCSRIASGNNDNSVKIWDAKTGEKLYEITGHSGLVNCMSVFPHCSRIVSGSIDRSVKVWGMVYYPAKNVYILLMKLSLIEDVVEKILEYCIAPKYELETLWKK